MSPGTRNPVRKNDDPCPILAVIPSEAEGSASCNSWRKGGRLQPLFCPDQYNSTATR
jgi:hypothetical protein